MRRLSITAGPDAECSQCQSWATVRFTFVGVDPANDCNINGLPDSCDADSDGDGIPNECDGPDLDSDGDGVIDAPDLAMLLSNWEIPGAAGDLNGDTVVDAADLATLLSLWGDCPA